MDYCRFIRALAHWMWQNGRIQRAEFFALYDDIKRHEFHTIGCEGKEAFESFAAANRVAKRNSRDGHVSRQAYRCRACGHFHIAPFDWGRRKRRIQRRRELEEDVAFG